MTRTLLLLLTVFLFSLQAYAQGVDGLLVDPNNATTRDASAVFQAQSTSQGVLISRMLQADRLAIPVSAARNGLLVYQTDGTPGFYYYNGTVWVLVANTAGTVTGFTGNLAGEVTGPQGATVVGNAAVIGKVLTGYVSGAGTILATDNILQAIQKLNGNDAVNANLTGPITSVGNATSIASQTGTGTTFAMSASPTFTGTPTLPTGTIGVTQTAGTNNTTLATTAFVTAANATNANLTGHVTSVGNATTLGSFTSANLATALTNESGSGLAIFQTSPSLITPVIGVATGTSLAVTGTLVNGAFDFILGNTDQVSRGNSGSSRALVKNTGSVLVVNYGGDFTGGTQVNSNLDVTGTVRIQGGTPGAGRVLTSDATGLASWVSPTVGTVTSIATGGNGITGGTITSSGTISLDYGTISTGGPRPVGNFGQYENHGTYTDANTVPNYWGWNYVQGNTNAPNATSTQWYRESVSLGGNYPGRGAGGYSMELAYPRNTPSAGVWMRFIENGGIGAWSRIDAGGTTFAGTTNYLARWTSATNLGIGATYDNGTSVGIGTNAPAQKLHVNGGDIQLNDAANVAGYRIKSYATGTSAWLMSGNTTDSRLVLSTSAHDWDRAVSLSYTPGTTGAAAGNLIIGQLDKNNANWTHGITQLYTNGTERMRIASNGNVGIGATGPAAKLHVAGGGQILGTNGTSSTTRTLTLLEDGDAQLNFGSYPGAWTSALQIQNNDNTDFIWMSPLADGNDARIMTAGSGLDIYTGGSAGSGGTFVAKFNNNGSVGTLNMGTTVSDPSVDQGNNWITWGYRSDNAAYYCLRTEYKTYGSSTYSRLQLNWHTGIEIGASTSYGGTRFFNNSPGVGAMQIMSVGDGDNHVRVNNALLVGNPSGTEAGYSGYWWRSRHDVDILDNDAGGTVAGCNVGATGVVTNVNIYTELYHTFIGDLILDVYAPDGTSDRIWNRAGGSADNIIQWFNNRSVFNGRPAKGGWSLWMGDFVSADGGYLNDWIVQVTTAAWSVGAGDVVASGRLVAGGNKIRGDMAEFFTSMDDLQPGQVVEIANNSDGDVSLSSKEYGASVLGVVTTDPSLILNSSASGYPIALEGRVPVFVNDEGGFIKKGEYITSSSVTGVARKATHSGHCIGIAMEDQKHANDKISVLLQRGWVDIGIQIQQSARVNDGGRVSLANATTARVQFKERFTGINKDEIFITVTAVNSPASLWVSDIDEMGFTINANGQELKDVTVNWNATATRVTDHHYTVNSKQDEQRMATVMKEMMADATSKRLDDVSSGPMIPSDLKPEFETKPETLEETLARYKQELKNYVARGGNDVAKFEADMNAKIAIVKEEGAQ